MCREPHRPLRIHGPIIRQHPAEWARAVLADMPHHAPPRSEEHTSELQSRENLVCRLLLEKKKYSTLSRLKKWQFLHDSNQTRMNHDVLFYIWTPYSDYYPLSLHDALPISRTSQTAQNTRPHYPPASGRMGTGRPGRHAAPRAA